MGKRKRNRRRRATGQRCQRYGKNRHHLLFQGRHWETGAAKILRNQFIYLLDIRIHDELHNTVLHDIPKPSPEALQGILQAFRAQEQEISQFGIVEAAEWLTMASNEEPYHSCMARQAQFLRERLKK